VGPGNKPSVFSNTKRKKDSSRRDSKRPKKEKPSKSKQTPATFDPCTLTLSPLFSPDTERRPGKKWILGSLPRMAMPSLFTACPETFYILQFFSSKAPISLFRFPRAKTFVNMGLIMARFCF
jgi:hypothetical protein